MTNMSEFANPQQLIDKLTIKEGMMVAEFGAGSGGMAIPLARKLQGGRLYAFDIQPEVLEVLRSKATAEGLVNIETRVCDLEMAEATRLPEHSVDLVVLANILFQVENKQAVLKEAARILRQGGQLIVIDWQANAPLGPKKGRAEPTAVRQDLEKFGLTIKQHINLGDYHYLLVAEPKVYYV